LVPFKVAAIMGFSKELAEVSVIEAAVRTMLSQSVAAGLDNIAFGVTPPGSLLVGVTPIAASTATPLETAMRQDLQNLVAALTAPSADVVFVMSPSRAVFASSVLPSSFAYTIVASTALPAATVVAVDAAGVAAALSARRRSRFPKTPRCMRKIPRRWRWLPVHRALASLRCRCVRHGKPTSPCCASSRMQPGRRGLARGLRSPPSPGRCGMITSTENPIDTLKAATGDDRLLDRATLDCIEAMVRFAVVGRSIPEAITVLCHWSNVFEHQECLRGGSHDR
jgi:hypothetical protein